jgi:hypothetical protein
VVALGTVLGLRRQFPAQGLLLLLLPLCPRCCFCCLLLAAFAGHTANNRLGVCAMRAAPVQVTWIGYPNSTGLAAVDYRLTDAICDPDDSKQVSESAMPGLGWAGLGWAELRWAELGRAELG